MKILVCNLGLLPMSTFLPYLYARLRTYIEVDYDKHIDLKWQTPIFRCYDNDVSAEEILKDIDVKNLDMLLTSNYTWNINDQLELSRYVKKVNPNCFIIAGGPEIEYKNLKVFERLDCVDAICYAEIESVMPEFLYNYQNNIDYDINGIILKTNPLKPRTPVLKIECKDIIGKPYTHLKHEFIKWAKEIKSKGSQSRVAVSFETNRGCPYGCTFCDWGSATASKIKKFQRDYVMEEIDSVMELKPDLVLIVDANFGIFEDDLDYIYKLIECKKKNNYVTTVAFSSAKNKKTRATQAHVALHKEDMLKVSHMGIQHTDEEVTKIMDRDNIKAIESIKEINDGLKAGVPLVPALIVGSPGDSIDKWKTAITDLMCMSFHDDVRLHDFQLLPNSPAMDTEYMEKYKIGYIDKTYHEMPNSKRKASPAKFVAETFSYTKEDFVEMQTWSYFYLGFHTLGIFKWAALYAHHTLNIHYKDFYDRVANLKTVKDIISHVRIQMHRFVLEDAVNKFIDYDNRLWQPDAFVYYKSIENLETLYEEFCVEFKDDFGDVLNDIIAFNKFIQINFEHEHETTIGHNFKDYFKDVLQTPAFEKSKLIPKKERTVYVNDGYLGLQKEYLIPKVNNINQYKENIYNKILKQAPNYRHRLYYYHGAIKQ